MAMTKPTSDQINFQNSVALPQSLTVDGTTYDPQAAQVGWTFGSTPTPRHRIIVVEVAV